MGGSSSASSEERQESLPASLIRMCYGMPVTEITALRTRLHELQRRSRRLVQPEPAELPGMHWAMVRSLRAASRSAARGSRKFGAGRRANPCGATQAPRGTVQSCFSLCRVGNSTQVTVRIHVEPCRPLVEARDPAILDAATSKHI